MDGRLDLREIGLVSDEYGILDVLGFSAPSFLMAHLQMTQDCVKLLNRDGRILYANRNALDELLDGNADSVRDSVWSEHWPVAVRPTLEDAVERAAQGEAVQCDLPRGGSQVARLWRIRLAPIGPRDGSVEAVLVVSHALAPSEPA